MFEDNKPFEEFRDKLNARGVIMRSMWEAKSGLRHRVPTDPDGPRRSWTDVALYVFSLVGESDRLGTGPADVEKIHVNTAIMIDYGADGFGIWYEAKTNKIEDDVDYIIRGPQPERRTLRQALEDERDHLLGNPGDSAFEAGRVRDRLKAIETQLATLDPS